MKRYSREGAGRKGLEMARQRQNGQGETERYCEGRKEGWRDKRQKRKGNSGLAGQLAMKP